MSRELTIKEKIQIMIKNRKEITFSGLCILIVILYVAYLVLEINF
ncbi:hypothetical protein [Intestinibacter sp.]|nr:hypothetical protein [Intestinibacter sp.]